MNINLPEHQEAFINQQIKTGAYHSLDELFQDLIADYMLQTQPELKASIDAGIARGLADVAAGKTMSSSECFDGIREELQKKYGQNA